MSYYHLVKCVAQGQSYSGCHNISFQTIWWIVSVVQTYLSSQSDHVIPVKINDNICFLWCEFRVDSKSVCDLYFGRIVLAVIFNLKGRLNSTIKYSALGRNNTLLFSALCIWTADVPYCWMYLLKFLNCSCHCAFCSFSTSNIPQHYEHLCLFIQCF